MLQKLKELVSGKGQKTQLEQVPRAELKDKPFTLALLLRAATEVDESKRDLDRMVRRPTRPIVEQNTLEKKIESAASVVALSIVAAAAEQAGCKIIILPGERLTVEAQMAIAFGFVIIMGMVHPLGGEGCKLDFRQACVGLVSAILPLREPEEVVEAYSAIVEIFQRLARASREHANVKEWLDNTTRLVLWYVEQFTTPKPKLKEMKLLPLFGSQLKVFLSTRE